MTHSPYVYNRYGARRYVFVSIGKKNIEKVVDFVPLKAKNYMNLGFGDLLPDGTVDTTANSNNGDILKALATVVDILKHFTDIYPNAIVFFTGSTKERTKLYARILRTYYTYFSEEFIIYAVVGTEQENNAISFDPKTDLEYLAFLVKRIN